MNTYLLLLIVALSGAFCYWIEQKLAWLSHFSGICLTILLGIILSGLDVIPHEHQLYDFFMGPVVLLAIALMAFGLRLDQLVKLPKSLLLIFGVGTLASILGGIIAAVTNAKALGINSAKVAAQLAASYIGGNENAVAVARMLDVPNEMFVAVFSVDSIVTSLWMIVSIATITVEPVEEVKSGQSDLPTENSESRLKAILGVGFSLVLALSTVYVSRLAEGRFGIFHPIMYLTVLATLLGQFKPLHTWLKPSYLMGSVLFVPFFFSTGAISNPKYLSQLPLSLALMPFLIVAIHGTITYGIGYLSKTPLSYTSIASQSLVGGAGTAIASARAKNWKEGIFYGLVLGLAGYAIANACGLLVYSISSRLIHFLGLI